MNLLVSFAFVCSKIYKVIKLIFGLTVKCDGYCCMQKKIHGTFSNRAKQTAIER